LRTEQPLDPSNRPFKKAPPLSDTILQRSEQLAQTKVILESQLEVLDALGANIAAAHLDAALQSLKNHRDNTP
jgi:hypothetical protein